MKYSNVNRVISHILDFPYRNVIVQNDKTECVCSPPGLFGYYGVLSERGCIYSNKCLLIIVGRLMLAVLLINCVFLYLVNQHLHTTNIIVVSTERKASRTI